MRVLIIKMTSMGDVIHALPALSDALSVFPSIEFDWVVEKPFSEVPALHPAVQEVMPIELRRWRKEGLFKRYRDGTIPAFIKTLKARDYDAVIDLQGLFKSSIISRFAKGKRYGFDRKSAREGISNLFYQTGVAVSKEQHAVERNRELFAKVLGYDVPDTRPDYGIKEKVNVPEAKAPYLVFLVNTTWETKLYPETYWVKLGQIANEAGYEVYLTSGNPEEKQRVDRIAAQLDKAVALPRQEIVTIAKLLKAAVGAFAVDTGFAHLAAALSTRCVSMYGPTDADLTGAYGYNQQRAQASYLCSPCLEKQCFHPDNEGPTVPPCFKSVQPDWVWSLFENLLEITGYGQQEE